MQQNIGNGLTRKGIKLWEARPKVTFDSKLTKHMGQERACGLGLGNSPRFVDSSFINHFIIKIIIKINVFHLNNNHEKILKTAIKKRPEK